MISQRLIGLAIASLCTAYIVHSHRQNIRRVVQRLVKRPMDSWRDDLTGITDWQEAYTAIQSEEFGPNAESQLLKMLEMNDSVEAKLAMANLTFFGTLHMQPDYERAFQMFEQIYTDTGHPSAAHMLGLFYAEAIGVSADPARALVLHTVAARSGSFPAHLTLAHWYSSGLHVSADCPTARSHYFEAAQQVDLEVSRRKRKYRSVVPPESIVDPKRRDDVLALFPSRDLIEYYQYSADKGSIESLVIIIFLTSLCVILILIMLYMCVDNPRTSLLSWRS